MLRDDLAEARKQWLAEVTDDPQEYAQRQQSDFLTDTNHEGEVIDFHSLRHTCGAWLAMTGVYPKVVQQVMRHQSITLTMDTYGHLFPGQEADAVGRLRQMLADDPTPPDALRATGTDDQTAKGALQLAQQLERETTQTAAKRCEEESDDNAQKKTPKPLVVADLDDDVRPDAKHSESAPSRTRTLNLLIKSQLLCQLS